MFVVYCLLGIGDWGLGIGPIPNPQSPIPTLSVAKLNTYNVYDNVNF